MSRSTKLSELKAGLYLVIISDANKSGNKVVIRYSTHDDKSIDVEYDISKEPFLKLCYAISSIKGDLIFDSQDAIGKRLWIAVKEVWTRVNGTVTNEVFDTLPYSEFMPEMYGNPMAGEIGGQFIEVLNTGSKGLSEAEKKAFIEQTKKVLTKDEFDEI